MNFRHPIPRSGKPIKKKARSKAEFARIYGSKARVEFVKSLPCAACGVVGYSVNAHLLGNGGMSRKGDYTTVGPLCGAPWGPVCHILYDEHRSTFDARFPRFSPAKVAQETEELWMASLGSAPGGQT